MIAFELSLRNGGNLSVCFPPDGQCVVSINNNQAFVFYLEDGQLAVQQHPLIDGVDEIVIDDIREIEAPELDAANYPRCCTDDQGEEHCATGGCYKAPCGWICG